jgi:hypothetical protein
MAFYLRMMKVLAMGMSRKRVFQEEVAALYRLSNMAEMEGVKERLVRAVAIGIIVTTWVEHPLMLILRIFKHIVL